MNWSKVICIEVIKYNDSQLDVICEQTGAIPGILKKIKSQGTTKLFLEEGIGVIGWLKKKELQDKYDVPLYKGLLLNKDYTHLTKKEKDRLLKIQPTDFNTKKNSVKKVTDSKIVIEVVEILEVDAILDKISKLGIKSLTKNEKNFLDDLSKS